MLSAVVLSTVSGLVVAIGSLRQRVHWNTPLVVVVVVVVVLDGGVCAVAPERNKGLINIQSSSHDSKRDAHGYIHAHR
jgi:hypothetical protein